MSGNQVIQREKRFEVGSTKDFDVVVSRGESDETLYFADLMDFSRSGLKFCLPFSARFDEMLRIRLTFKTSELQYFGLGRVRHIRNTDTNRWVVGCSIDPKLPDELINHLASVTHQERRKNPRIEVDAKGFLSRQGKIEEVSAEIRNISKGGFCLFVNEAPETGSQVNFTIDNRFGFQEHIDARIRWQKADEGGFLIGLNFVDDQSYERLVNCLDMPTTKSDLDFSEIVDWKLVVCAMIAMLMPSVSYVLLGSSLGANNTDMSHAINSRRVEVQRVANPSEVNSFEKKKTLVETNQPRLKKRPGEMTKTKKTVTPNKVEQGKSTKQSRKTKQPTSKTKPTSKKKQATLKKKSVRQANSKPPIELTRNQTAKPRRLRMSTTSVRIKKPAKTPSASKTTTKLISSTKHKNSTTRRSKDRDGIDIPSESIRENLPKLSKS